MPKNFRMIPDFITARLANLGNAEFQVGIVKRIALPDITAGNWAQAGINIADGVVTLESPLMPDPANGRASYINAHGKTVIRKDLPKETRDINLGERPIWGDWGNGGFDLTVSRECYQRDNIPAPLIMLESRQLETEETGFGVVVIYIHTNRIHRMGTPNVEADILHDLNLIQENVGSVDVIAADASDDDLLGRVYVNWEILPPGQRDATLAAILNRYRPQNDEDRGIIQERFQALTQFEPDRWIIGQHRFSGYFGIIKNDAVILENVRYGNALYRMDIEEWVELSQHSRTDLLTNHADRIQRIVHTPGWQARLANALAD